MLLKEITFIKKTFEGNNKRNNHKRFLYKKIANINKNKKNYATH